MTGRSTRMIDLPPEMRVLFVMAGACWAAAQTLPRPVAVNGAAPGFAFDAAFDVHPGGSVTFVWDAYEHSREQVFFAFLRKGRLARPRLLSPGPAVYYQSVFAATGARAGWAVWMRQAGRAWQIVGRELRDGEWAPVTVLAENALAPSICGAGGRAWLAWEDHSVKPQRIRMAVWDGRSWSVSEPFSDAAMPAYRPAVAAGGWLAWDAYDGREYAVLAMAPGERPERVSRPGKDGLKPAIVPGAVAWVATEQVRGGAGVLDHADSLHIAFYRDGKWQPAQEAADLRWGLLPQIEPKPSSMSGYAGRRRQPMLARDGDALWLLWERKAIHDGPSDTTGQLCGRRFVQGRAGESLLLHEGLVDYRVDKEFRAGRLLALGRGIHHNWLAFEVDPAAARGLPSLAFSGWKPVRLPLRRGPPRPSIEIGGARYFLYWGDLHVHSVLTPDAEGEPDEIMHFARDRALLDVIVMQENDANSWMNRNPEGAFRNHLLPQAEYELSVYYSRRYTEPGRFVALPGWEWSQRTDDNKPNHRTVIFAGDETPIVRHPENGSDFDALCDIVEAAGGLMNTQHESFRLVNRPCDANIELATGWGNYIRQPEKIHADLSAGFKVGFIATSDGHRRNPGTGGGLTGIWAAELTPRAIFEALRERRVFATTGARVSIDARANGVFMGQDVESKGEVVLSLEAASERRIVRAVLVRDGREIYTASSGSARFTDRPGRGFHWYYWRIELEGEAPDYPGNMKVAEGNLAWSSPHRVHVR